MYFRKLFSTAPANAVRALVFLCLITGCGGRSNELRIESRNFEQEIEQEQNLVFTFDKELAPKDALQKWDTSHYITFNPAVKGRFKWTAPNELVFSPLKPFAPSTDYQAELTKELLTHSKTKYKIPQDQSIRFHTPYLNLSEAKAFWTTDESTEGELEARLDLTFNYPVSASLLPSRLHIYNGAVELPIELVSGNTEDGIGIRIKRNNIIKDDALPLKISIAPGLTTAGTTYQTKLPLEREIILPSRNFLTVSEVTTGVENGEEHIYVATTQPVQTENLAGLITLKPRVNFTVEEMDGGFVIKGNIPQDNTYDLTISKNLTGLGGVRMGKDYQHTVSFESLRPGISFVSGKSVYLSSQGARNIALNIVKVPRMKVSIGKVYENNILRLLREGKMYDGEYDEEADEYFSSSYYAIDETNGNTIFEREFDTKNLRRQGNSYLLNLNLDDLDFDSEFKGLYVLTVTSTDKKWLGDSKIISVSDIGLIVKQGKNEVVVFANSIREAQPQNGVEVRFISTNNQTVYKATTDQEGVARFPDLKTNAGDFKVGMITARLGQDFTYLPYSQTQVNTSRFEVGGKRQSQLNYDAYIYGDRNLYRPGDAIHLNTIVRTPDWKTVAGLPIKIKLLLPTGKEFKSIKAKLNQEGASETTFQLPTAAVTGTYTVEVYSGNDVLLNSEKIGVEEFMPDRLKVTANLNKKTFKAGDSLVTKFVANNLFGPPAVGRNYEVQLALKKKQFEAKKYPDYNFDIVTSGTINIQNSVRQGQTNANGTGQETFALTGYKDIGVLDGSVYTTVFDETGRPVNRLSKFEVSTQPIFFGIKDLEDYVSTRQPLRIPLLAVNQNGQPVATTARVQLVRFTYESVIERSEDENYNYRSQRKENIISSKNINIPASGYGYVFNPISWQYEVRIMRPGALNYVAQEFYAYGWGDTETTSFEVNNEGEVDITLDKTSYEVGEEANILFKSPFAGKILVTVEQNSVISHHYLTTDKKAASLSLPIKDEHLPTIYITATALRPIKDNQLPLTIARGFMPVTVTKKDTKLEVAITAPEASRSKRTQEIKINTAANAQVTLAVVDEGILQLKDYITPNPHTFFYQKRALEVEAYDLYPFLFPELTGKRQSSFGGDGFDLEKRVNPLTSKRVKLVSLWSGILKTDGDGEARVKVPIPEFSGSLRVMAVAYKDNAFGSAEKMMRVSDPVIISTALPRFVSPKDTIYVPVTLSNTTQKNASASSSLILTGPLRVVGAASQSANIKPNSEAQVLYKLVANSAIGNASVKVNVNALGEQFTNFTEISVRPTASLTKITGAGSLAGDKAIEINPAHNFIPTTVASKLVISRSPIAQFTDDITYLLQYPHGCLEQTTSKAFPLLYYSDLAKSLNQDRKVRTYNPNYLVQEAITKIEAMQQYDGGFTYWPGEEQTDWWTSTYATHFLLEARKAGYPVNAAVISKVLTYLQRKVKSKGMEEYRYYNAIRQLQSKYIASHEVTYSLYVLAIARKPDWATMNYYKSKPALLSLDAKYLLASTYALAGRREAFNQLVPRKFAGESSVRALDGSFYSATRDMALALNSLLEVDADNPQIGTLSKHLSQELRSNRWYNTQERSFALLTLGKMARRSKGTATAKVYQNGKVIGSFTGKDISLVNKINSSNISIKPFGTGTLYYFWETEGIPQSGPVAETDESLQVRRTYYTRDGEKITNNTFRQNDLIVVRIALQSLDGRSIPNVAITDLLPAGFEIENSRILANREFKWLADLEPDKPDYLDNRDDRINIYATATPKQQFFFYQVRAVSKGNFNVGPVSADAMYNAEYNSYNGAGVVRVR